jgi:hypothetical protein
MVEGHVSDEHERLVGAATAVNVTVERLMPLDSLWYRYHMVRYGYEYAADCPIGLPTGEGKDDDHRAATD